LRVHSRGAFCLGRERAHYCLAPVCVGEMATALFNRRITMRQGASAEQHKKREYNYCCALELKKLNFTHPRAQPTPRGVRVMRSEGERARNSFGARRIIILIGRRAGNTRSIILQQTSDNREMRHFQLLENLSGRGGFII
jgi:hypothetical protein